MQQHDSGGQSRRSRLYYRKPDVLEAFGFSPATLNRLEARGEFPRRRQLAGRTVAWLASEVEAWAQSRPVANIPPVPPKKEAA